MTATSSIRAWRGCVADLLPALHGHQQKALADFAFACAAAGSCQAGQLANHVPTAALPASSARRFERLLANDRLDPTLAQADLARVILATWTGLTVRLLLDETAKANDLRLLCIRLAHAHRAVPLASVCYQRDALPQPMPVLVRSLLEQVAATLPAHCTVVLLADRGLAWPVLVDWCNDHGWHYVLRLQSQTRVRFADGSEKPVTDLAKRPGQTWLGAAEVFKKAGWRGANVVATWRRGQQVPWLVLTDQKASLKHCGLYGKRMWVEESFRDDKGTGFHWEQSQVNEPAHAERLLLVLAVAAVLVWSIGEQQIKRGRRQAQDPHSRRRLSVFQLGLRWLHYVVAHSLYHLLRLERLYLYPK